MKAYLSSVNLFLFSVVFVVLLMSVFYGRGEIIIKSKNSEQDNTQAVIDLFRQKDTIFVDEVLKMDPTNFTETEAMYKFYYLLSFPLQGVCRVLKRIGGRWLDWPILNGYAVDGDKFICMDNIILGKPCLIYSFGIMDDWTFEDLMDYRGCEIHAYDPSVDFPAKRGGNINFSKLGLGVEPNMDTLANILRKNGHTNTNIEMLKVDIETNELLAAGIPDWLATGALDNVNQLAIELHLGSQHEGPTFIWLLDVLQQMYKLNFRVISHEVNMVAGPEKHKLYNFMEVVFMKDNVWSMK